jgi:hypothetical protein
MKSGQGGNALPLGLVKGDVGVRHPQVPDDGLEGFAVWRDVVGVDRRDENTGIGVLFGVAAIFADNANNSGSDLLGQLDSVDKSWGYIVFKTAPANRKNHKTVLGTELGPAKPLDINAGPTLIIGAGGEF